MPDKKLTDEWLKEIREKISCPQFGNEHYGEWGILTLNQRRTIKRLLDFIEAQEKYINRQKAEIENLNIERQAMRGAANSYRAENKRLQELVDDMGDYFPACINCEGKTEFGERTDKCVYLIDNTNYCTKRGITNIVAIQNENCSLKESLKTAKSEAIKEFAERLKDMSEHFWEEKENFVSEEQIDNLLKELVGDNNES